MNPFLDVGERIFILNELHSKDATKTDKENIERALLAVFVSNFVLYILAVYLFFN